MARPTRLTPEMISSYAESGHWTRSTTLDLLDQHAVERPADIALVDSAIRLTWAAARAAVHRLAAQLAALDLPRDTPVVVQLPNGAEACLIRLALKRIGLLGAYAPIVWRRNEIARLVDRLRPGALVVPPAFRDAEPLAAALALRRRRPDLRIVVADGTRAPAEGCVALSLAPDAGAPPPGPADERSLGPFEVTALALTSGSTGDAKIVEMTEQQQLLWGKGIRQRLRLAQDDHIGGFVPLAGGPGHAAWVTWLITGAKLVLSDGFAPENVLPLIGRERLRLMMTAPTILARLLDAPDLDDHDFGSLRAIRTGSAYLPARLAAEAERRLGCVVANAGGAMETCSFGQVALDDAPQVRHGSSLGKVFPGAEAMVVDDHGSALPTGAEGELWMRGPTTGSGYFGDADATEAAWGELGPGGWFRTGDMATIDAQGYIALVGRKKDMINRGGVSVYPLEVETALADHPKILEAAVVPIPEPRLGEVPCLCVVAREGPPVTLDEVHDFLRALDMARHKFPVRVLAVDDFPRGATLRIDRRRLTQLVAARLDDGASAAS